MPLPGIASGKTQRCSAKCKDAAIGASIQQHGGAKPAVSMVPGPRHQSSEVRPIRNINTGKKRLGRESIRAIGSQHFASLNDFHLHSVSPLGQNGEAESPKKFQSRIATVLAICWF
jgi:hypothetical protein